MKLSIFFALFAVLSVAHAGESSAGDRSVGKCAQEVKDWAYGPAMDLRWSELRTVQEVQNRNYCLFFVGADDFSGSGRSLISYLLEVDSNNCKVTKLLKYGYETQGGLDECRFSQVKK
ncbi:MAG: hypothetical protein KF802_15705 [Bdellovibrionaceae bacterium]|nr:hypothetical protein [Pseudobdellovibrionaceae bacterium]